MLFRSRHLLPGDVVVQRGTNHAWANRSDRPCRIAFVLLDGVYDPVIAASLGKACRWPRRQELLPPPGRA